MNILVSEISHGSINFVTSRKLSDQSQQAMTINQSELWTKGGNKQVLVKYRLDWLRWIYFGIKSALNYTTFVFLQSRKDVNWWCRRSVLTFMWTKSRHAETRARSFPKSLRQCHNLWPEIFEESYKNNRIAYAVGVGKKPADNLDDV